MDLSALFGVLKPVISAEGQKVIDSLVFPEIESLINSKVEDPIIKALLLHMLPMLKAAADAELQALLK